MKKQFRSSFHIVAAFTRERSYRGERVERRHLIFLPLCLWLSAFGHGHMSWASACVCVLNFKHEICYTLTLNRAYSIMYTIQHWSSLVINHMVQRVGFCCCGRVADRGRYCVCEWMLRLDSLAMKKKYVGKIPFVHCRPPFNEFSLELINNCLT